MDKYARKEAEGAECRARVQWRVDGEKPSKYFCNLEKFNALQKYIPRLKIKNENGKESTINEQKKIDLELYKFYQNLYRSQEANVKILTIEKFLGTENSAHPKLSENQALTLEGTLTLQEATNYMKKCRSDASPGSSGFTGAFYKLFWRNLKTFIVNSLNFAYESGNLSISQKLGIIILLPKPDKDKLLLSNWRPISLLNHIYKILSGALAERIKPVLPHIIHNDQKGFVSGRYIGECVRNTYDIIEYAKAKNKAGLLLLIDFEKAFDSISHSFVIKALKFFGFGYSFIKWINVTLNDLSSCINHCGNITDRFKVGRSCRQGDPLSPYLFIICVEILALKIRKDEKVRGFKLGNYEKKMDFYADDLTAFLDGSEKSLEGMVLILDEFKLLSGLKINLSKCKAVWIGRNRFFNLKLCQELGLIWSSTFRLLGIDFDSDLASMDTNFRTKIDEIKKLYNSWLYRHLSPIGRITIIKSLALSKLSHVVLACPHISPNVLKELTSMSFNFLWKNKPDRIKRCEVTLPYDKGGLNMPDIDSFWSSLKMSWSRRLMDEDCAWQKILKLNLIYENYELSDILYGGPTLLTSISEKLTNVFWKETIKVFALITDEIPFAHPHFFYHLNVFDNQFFSANNVEIPRGDFWMLWQKNITQVGDFFNCEKLPPVLLSLEGLTEKYGIKLDFLSYHRIETCIKQAAKNLNHKIYNENLSDIQCPRLPLLYKLSCLTSKGCGIFYQTLRAREVAGRSTVVSEDKWHSELGTTFSINFWDKIWKNNKGSLVNNKMKWVTLQINRFVLPTNYTVNKYNKNQSPGCSFCTAHLEKLPYLL